MDTHENNRNVVATMFASFMIKTYSDPTVLTDPQITQLMCAHVAGVMDGCQMLDRIKHASLDNRIKCRTQLKHDIKEVFKVIESRYEQE